jgi:hypothetical protein
MTGERREEREREKIMPSLMATSLRWRTHSARTNYYHNLGQPKTKSPRMVLLLVRKPHHHTIPLNDYIYGTSIQRIFGMQPN